MNRLTLTRRTFLRGTAAGGGVLFLVGGGLAGRLLAASAAESASRVSRLFPGLRLVHADMHNHSLFSDGAGDASNFYTTVRGNGLDVASLTDHSTLQWGLPPGTNACTPFEPLGIGSDCQSLAGMTEDAWLETGEFADDTNLDGTGEAPGFTAIRGFEWSSPTLGHSNTWFSDRWIDPLHTGGVAAGTEAADFTHEGGSPAQPVSQPVNEALRQLIDAADPPVTAAMFGYYQWLTRAADTPVLEGGSDGIFGFNHPGREPGRFDEFDFESAVRDRNVSLELFNRQEDYLFEAVDQGKVSPLIRCLDRGWRPGILGVTDEHGTNWGGDTGKGRGGFWVEAFTRAGVRKAMSERNFFATRQMGLRVDGAANGQRMGQAFGHATGPVLFQLDVDRGPGSYGRTLLVQVLMTNQSGPLPTIVHSQTMSLPRPDQTTVEFSVDIDRAAMGDWVVIRLTDPEGSFDADSEVGDGRATGAYIEAGYAVAYLAPWYLTADAPPAPGSRAPGNDPEPDPDPTKTPTSTPTATSSPTNTPTATATPTGSPSPDPNQPKPDGFGVVHARVRRFAGETRFDTAATVSRESFAAGQAVAYVATGLDFPDALAAGPIAGAANAPILLTEPDTLHAATVDELRRLEVQRIVVLGGERVMSPAVAQELERIAPTTRVFGPDRFATAVALSQSFEPGVNEVLVASGLAFPDALTGGPAATRRGAPLLLVRPDGVPEVTRDELRRLAPSRIVVLGGPIAIRPDIADELAVIAPVDRRAGETRFDTAAEISRETFRSATSVVVTTGATFADALGAAPAAAVRRAPLLLVERDSIPAATDAELRRLRPDEIIIVGGRLAVSAAVEAALRKYEAG